MSTLTEWLWVVLGYGITYGAITTYLVVLGRRWALVRRNEAEQ